MTTPVIKGRAAIWGIKDTSGDTHESSIITRMSRKRDGETDFLFDNDGFTVTEIFFDDKDVVTIEVICETATSIPARGDDITIVSIDAIVQDAELVWEQKGWKKLSINATKFANLSVA